MKSIFFLRAAMLALASLVVVPQAAKAAPEDYEFQLVQNEIKQGDGAVVAIRLIDKRTGQPVENAVIFATRLDMAPDGMEMMATTVEPMPSQEPGIYRFKTNLTMAGGWRFSIAAKVQGEPETVESKLVLKAIR
ncbi:MAG: FixH family protein [Rhizobiaceae bacterium]|nr:FixH family protein [Rhizobiaceae bacterium]